MSSDRAKVGPVTSQVGSDATQRRNLCVATQRSPRAVRMLHPAKIWGAVLTAHDIESVRRYRG